jgi:hypothetical protein
MFQNFLKKWLIPPEMWNHAYKWKGEFASRLHGEILKSNLQLKNSHKGERCFIIGNGPSLKYVDLKMLKNEFTFVTNSFVLHKEYARIHPKCYCMIDQAQFKDTPATRAHSKDLNKKLQRDTILIVPIEAKAFFQRMKLFDGYNICYLLQQGIFKENLNFNIDITKALPNMINVMLACIITANYMGFEEIYLLGCDHNWLSTPNQAIQPRFFDNDYYKEEVDSRQTYERSIYCFFELFRNYRLLKTKLSNTRIFNCTPNSFLTLFPYVNLLKVIRKPS